MAPEGTSGERSDRSNGGAREFESLPPLLVESGTVTACVIRYRGETLLRRQTAMLRGRWGGFRAVCSFKTLFDDIDNGFKCERARGMH